VENALLSRNSSATSRLLPASSGYTHLVLKSPTVLTDVEYDDDESN
jgi:hypothetical protein